LWRAVTTKEWARDRGVDRIWWRRKALSPFQARFWREELIDRGGIVKESRKGTGLWDGCIGKEVVE
jgi:hypothetical protein